MAKYKCLNCGHEWEKNIRGGVMDGYGNLPHNDTHPEKCPVCEYLWFEWLNYGKAGDA